jgi:hypothetical protein
MSVQEGTGNIRGAVLRMEKQSVSPVVVSVAALIRCWCSQQDCGAPVVLGIRLRRQTAAWKIGERCLPRRDFGLVDGTGAWQQRLKRTGGSAVNIGALIGLSWPILSLFCFSPSLSLLSFSLPSFSLLWPSFRVKLLPVHNRCLERSKCPLFLFGCFLSPLSLFCGPVSDWSFQQSKVDA